MTSSDFYGGSSKGEIGQRVGKPQLNKRFPQVLVLDHMEDFAEETMETLLKNFHTDDCLTSASIVPKGIHIFPELCQLFALNDFQLTKSTSNSR